MNVAMRALVLASVALPPCVGAQALEQDPSGLRGHLVVGLVEPPGTTFKHGYSYYTSAHVLNPQPREGVGLGWGGSNVLPDNRMFAQPLCFPGTVAYDNWPERGPTWDAVFQSIEGGIGQWGSTRNPWATPKFRVNATPDCYNNQISTPGWQFWGATLPPDKLILAQLANRLVLPPDGIPFTLTEGRAMLGVGWLPLPLLPATTYPLGMPTGDRSWTLFLHTANFRGPVAFYTPEAWTALHALDDTGAGRGHDAMPGLVNSASIEIGATPVFTAEAAGGVRYRRVPRLLFPADANREAILAQDVWLYSKQAYWDSVAEWIANGTVAMSFDQAGIHVPALANPNFAMYLGEDPIDFEGGLDISTPDTAGGGHAFAFAWGVDREAGVFPEYYRETGDTWMPVHESEVPAETQLAAQTFRPATPSNFPPLDTGSGSPWAAEGWAAGPYTTSLVDGSIVEYVWYRFIDQPAIARLQLPPDVEASLQAFVESLHQHAGVSGPSIPPPTGGALAEVDPGLLVTPPPGLGAGYVPIAIGQKNPLVRLSAGDRAALEALYASTDGPNWTNNDNWLQGDGLDWHGVVVTGTTVTEIDLAANGLSGTLPDSLAVLSGLVRVELSGNQLQGSLPAWLGSLPDLRYLSVFGNQLSGSIPPELGQLASLTLLQLGNNQLSGAIPPALGQLGQLQFLLLAGNQLHGRLPPELAQLAQLRMLELGGNPLHGPFPTALQDLALLHTLTYPDTGLCDPFDGNFLAWLNALPTRVSSGLACEYAEVFRNGYEG